MLNDKYINPSTKNNTPTSRRRRCVSENNTTSSKNFSGVELANQNNYTVSNSNRIQSQYHLFNAGVGAQGVPQSPRSGNSDFVDAVSRRKLANLFGFNDISCASVEDLQAVEISKYNQFHNSESMAHLPRKGLTGEQTLSQTQLIKLTKLSNQSSVNRSASNSIGSSRQSSHVINNVGSFTDGIGLVMRNFSAESSKENGHTLLASSCNERSPQNPQITRPLNKQHSRSSSILTQGIKRTLSSLSRNSSKNNLNLQGEVEKSPMVNKSTDDLVYKDLLHLQHKIKQDFRSKIFGHMNILVLGNSSAGKTSVINALEDCLPFQKTSESSSRRHAGEGKTTYMTERLVFQDKTRNSSSYNNLDPNDIEALSHSSHFYNTHPAISLWDVKGLEKVADFDHASNVIKMILDGHIDDSQFNLCLMYRGVPEKSKHDKFDINRKKSIFNKKKRNFHAVILVCDATEEPPMRLLELFYDAVAKSTGNINKIPVVTVLTHCDVLEDDLSLVNDMSSFSVADPDMSQDFDNCQTETECLEMVINESDEDKYQETESEDELESDHVDEESTEIVGNSSGCQMSESSQNLSSESTYEQNLQEKITPENVSPPETNSKPGSISTNDGDSYLSSSYDKKISLKIALDATETSNHTLNPSLTSNPNLNLASTPRLRKISETFDPETTNSLYLKKVEQVFEPEILLATASVSDHSNLDIFNKHTELKRFEKFFNYLSDNVEKFSCYRDLIDLPILKQARSRNSSSNFDNQSSIKVIDQHNFAEEVFEESSAFNHSGQKKSSDSSRKQANVIRLDAKPVPIPSENYSDQDLKDYIKFRYNSLMAWRKIFSVMTNPACKIKRKPITKTISWSARDGDDFLTSPQYNPEIQVSKFENVRQNSLKYMKSSKNLLRNIKSLTQLSSLDRE